jgi:hypothetical protein
MAAVAFNAAGLVVAVAATAVGEMVTDGAMVRRKEKSGTIVIVFFVLYLYSVCSLF